MADLFLMMSLGQVIMFPLPVVIIRCSITNCTAYTIVPTIWLRLQPQFSLSAAPRSRYGSQFYSKVHSLFCDESFDEEWWSLRKIRMRDVMVVWTDAEEINNIADWLLRAVLHTTVTTALFVFKMHRGLTVNVILCTFVRKLGLFVCPFFFRTHTNAPRHY